MTTILPKHPKCIYKRGPTFGDKVVKSALNPPKQSIVFSRLERFYACKKCSKFLFYGLPEIEVTFMVDDSLFVHVEITNSEVHRLR